MDLPDLLDLLRWDNFIPGADVHQRQETHHAAVVAEAEIRPDLSRSDVLLRPGQDIVHHISAERPAEAHAVGGRSLLDVILEIVALPEGEKVILLEKVHEAALHGKARHVHREEEEIIGQLDGFDLSERLADVLEQASEDRLAVDAPLPHRVEHFLPPLGAVLPDFRPVPFVDIAVVTRLGIEEMLVRQGDVRFDFQLRIGFPEPFQESAHAQDRAGDVRREGMDPGGALEYLRIVCDHPLSELLVLLFSERGQISRPVLELGVDTFEAGADLFPERSQVPFLAGTGQGFMDPRILALAEDVPGSVAGIAGNIERLVSLRGRRIVPVREVVDIIDASVFIGIGVQGGSDFVRGEPAESPVRLGEGRDGKDQGPEYDKDSFHFRLFGA